MYKKYYPFLLLPYALMLIVLRSPVLFVTPRFWAEEGQKYFAYAYTHSFFDNLFSQFYGYYTLVPNVATSIASLAPLEWAPLVTTSLAVAMKLLVFTVVATGSCRYWDSMPKKIFVITSVVLISDPETWAHTIHSMFWLSIGTFFILLETIDKASLARRWFYRFILAVGGLTGVMSCFMTPVFWLKAYRSKLKEDVVHAAILSVCSALQVGVFVSSFLFARHSMLGGRLSSDGFDFFRLLLWHFVWPFIGRRFPANDVTMAAINKFCYMLEALKLDNLIRFTPWLPLVILSVGYFLFTIFRNRRDQQVQYMAISFVIVSTLSTVLSFSMASGGRYVLLPSCILLMIIYNSVLYNKERPIARYASLAILLLVMFSAASSYRARMRPFADPAWPVWSQEVKLWKNHRNHELLIWPQFKDDFHWSVKL